jgi:hypothetical protein
MTKYRIVEAKIPKLMDDDVTIKYLYRYDIERQVSIFLGIGKSWVKAGSHYKLEHAKAQIEFWNTEETWTVIDVD